MDMFRLVDTVQGLVDLVRLPMEQYKKDGRLMRGFQRGASSFGTSTAMAAVELTNRMVRILQVKHLVFQGYCWHLVLATDDMIKIK